ncbi:MAG: hypothetical protein JKY65_22900 [Planctomycetes bacterium]|nr:hypothetical protein [Planctomycetota bacterium]
MAKVLARLSIDALVKKKRFDATIPLGKILIGIQLIETRPETGITRLRNPNATSKERGSTFVMVPVVASDLALVVVNADGSALDPDKEFLIGQRIDLKAHLTNRRGSRCRRFDRGRRPGRRL